MRRPIMALFLCLSILIYHADMVLSLCSVNYCDPSYCNGTSCDKCFDGYFRHGSGDKCDKCYLYCKQCYDSQCYSCVDPGCSSDFFDLANCTTADCSRNTYVQCSSCPDGFYLSNNRCYRCINVNCKCTSASYCAGCLPGYYGIDYGCFGECPSNCTSCNSSENCDKCIAGKYGRTCGFDCITTCLNETCDKDSGTCMDHCASNEFLDSRVCKKCPMRCYSCINSTYCTDCMRSYNWGSECQYDCTGCYGKCNKSDGCSQGCTHIRYYQSYNEMKNGYECIRCPDGCATCNNRTLCESCISNRWGNVCQYNCSGCRNICNAFNGCDSGCISGYYREATESGFVCVSCAKGCQTCKTAAMCQTCTADLWGTLCQYNCSGCSSECDALQGCETGCLQSYYRTTLSTGHQCVKCSDKCKSCSSITTCIECEVGYFPDDEGSCTKCPDNCIESDCDETNGRCIVDCSGAFGGLRCDQKCPHGCLTCEQSNVSICRQCDNGLFGTACEKTCSVYCKRVGPGIPICHKTDGACVNGCENGHWGKQCSLACESGCLDDFCNKTDGVCLNGCKENYYGDTCSNICDGNLVFVPVCNLGEVSTKGSDFQASGSDNNNNGATVGLAVIVGITVLLLATSVTANVILLKKLRGLPLQEADKVPANTIPGGQMDTNTYQDLSRRGPDERTYSSLTQEYENNF